MHREQLRQADLDTDEWDEAATEVLEDVEYDTELGKQMGRDAIRLARGELSEQAFYERYHEAVVAEFGTDDRPIDPED